MPPLPLNFGSELVMKWSVIALLFIAPFLLLFAGFVPLVLLDNWLKIKAGMPLMEDLSDHPWGAWVDHLMGILLVLFLIVGYFLGWAVNAVWLFAARKWSLAQIKATFLHSQLPTTWLRRKELSEEQLQALLTEFKEWEQIRTAGSVSYIFANGLKASLVFFVAMACARFFRKDPTLLSSSWVLICLLSATVGFAISTMLWFWREHRFAYRGQFRDEV